LEPVERLAEACDPDGIVRGRLRVPTDKRANTKGMPATIVAGMLTEADSIDDLDVVRRGTAGCGETVRHPAQRRFTPIPAS
jgi:hypothetical protein